MLSVREPLKSRARVGLEGSSLIYLHNIANDSSAARGAHSSSEQTTRKIPRLCREPRDTDIIQLNSFRFRLIITKKIKLNLIDWLLLKKIGRWHLWTLLFASKVKQVNKASALKHSSHVNMILVCFPFIKGMPGVLEKVLDYLDHQSLSNTHQVCKQWNDAVIRSRCWRRQLLHKVWQSLNLLT